MTDEEILQVGKQIHKSLRKTFDSPEKAVAALSVAESLIDRSMAQNDIIKGKHLEDERNENQ